VADKKPKLQAADPGAEGPPEPSLGAQITEARERKGLTRDQVATDAHLPPHYVKMIETDSYDMISDRLYLVPFLRRYATFLGLDAEEVASRFVSNVQHAEANVVRISQEITMVAKKPGSGGRIAFALLIAAVILLLADFAWRRLGEREAIQPAPTSPAAMAPNESLPPATVVNNPEAAAPPSSGVPAGVPQSPSRPAQPQQIPRAATDDN
jgi:cytoskeleton protein RodZ